MKFRTSVSFIFSNISPGFKSSLIGESLITFFATSKPFKLLSSQNIDSLDSDKPSLFSLSNDRLSNSTWRVPLLTGSLLAILLSALFIL